VKTHALAIRNSHGHAAHSWAIKEHLGLRSEAKIPVDGMPRREIQGVTVYVVPLLGEAKKDSSWAFSRAYRRCKHRVRAICPVCQKDLSAGRLNQHLQLAHPED
jgi:hypothetical protein